MVTSLVSLFTIAQDWTMVRVSGHDSHMTLLQKDIEGKDSQLLSLVCLFPSREQVLFLTLRNAVTP